ERERYITSQQQKGMKTLAKDLAETHGQRQLMHQKVVLIIAHIIHIQDSRYQQADGYAGRESQPRPAWNLHIIRSPRHQKAHSDVDQDVAQPARGKFEWPRAIEVRDA